MPAGRSAGGLQGRLARAHALETLTFEYINRCRSDPAEDGLRCPQTPGIPASVDLKMFKLRCRGQAGPAAGLRPRPGEGRPLAQLLLSATPGARGGAGKEGLPAKILWKGPRWRAFTGGMFGENCGHNGTKPWFCHCGLRGRLGAARGSGRHAAQARPSQRHPQSRYRGAGIGCVPWPGAKNSPAPMISLPGPPHARRRGDQRLEDNTLLRANEAVGGVPISTGKARTKSWKSGAYAIELPEKTPGSPWNWRG